MSSLTIRNLEPRTKDRLRVRAALNGRSMEEEVRVILGTVVGGVSGPDLWRLSRQLFEGEAGVNLDFPDRGADRPAPDYG